MNSQSCHAAAGLVKRLESLADLDSRSGAPLAKAMHEAAAFITTLLSELERVGKERDEAQQERDDTEHTLNAWFDTKRAVEADIVEKIVGAFEGYLRVCRCGGMPTKQSDLASAAFADFARLDLADVIVPLVRTMAEAAEARALKAEALVAEAVRVCEPFGEMSDRLHSGYDAGIAAGDDPYVYIAVRHLRAARAFIDRAKES